MTAWKTIFLQVESKIVEKAQMCVSFKRWLTESETYKGKIESCYTLSAKTKTGIKEGATESTDFVYFVCQCPTSPTRINLF
jgi:hypothetical protein